MRVIHTRNVHQALAEGIRTLSHSHDVVQTRNGPALVSPTPVTTVYERPCERVLFWAERDANPFFHFFESLWMLAGRQDVDFVAQFVERMREFSDDGRSLHGAYGWRWRNHFEHDHLVHFDQLGLVIDLLRNHPRSRRAVLTMWDPAVDLTADESGRDKPCNTHIYFQRRDDVLDMTVCCRSNDIVWGAYGANSVHFSMLQEYIASMLGCQVGRHYHVSNNYHAYVNVIDPLLESETFRRLNLDEVDPYALNQVRPFPVVEQPQNWMLELGKFMMDPEASWKYTNPFFPAVAVPLWRAHKAFKDKSNPHRFELALEHLSMCYASDWRKAAIEWVQRRQAKAHARQDS